MSGYVITVTIPEDVAKSAEELGLLSSSRYVTWLRQKIAEHEEERIARIRAELAAIFAASKNSEPQMSDEEIDAIIREGKEGALLRLRQMWAALDAIEPRLTEEEIEQWIREARTERE